MIRSTLLLSAAVALLSLTAHAETLRFQATMDGKSEVPPHEVAGTGMVEATLDTAAKTLAYSANWKDLSGPATAGHFHGPAAAGANAGVVLPWGNNPGSPFKATATLTDAQMADLKAGKWYANLHTAKNPGGEIRGQMTRQ